MFWLLLRHALDGNLHFCGPLCNIYEDLNLAETSIRRVL